MAILDANSRITNRRPHNYVCPRYQRIDNSINKESRKCLFNKFKTLQGLTDSIKDIEISVPPDNELFAHKSLPQVYNRNNKLRVYIPCKQLDGAGWISSIYDEDSQELYRGFYLGGYKQELTKQNILKFFIDNLINIHEDRIFRL